MKISLDIHIYTSEEQQSKHVAEIDRISEVIRTILHRYDPSKILDKSATLSELHHDPYQDLFNLLPYLVKANASVEVLEQELKEELSYFDRTNTIALKTFKDFHSLAAELSEIEGKQHK